MKRNRLSTKENRADGPTEPFFCSKVTVIWVIRRLVHKKRRKSQLPPFTVL
ncbi:hypothetical protein [Bacteroides ihuae]|uniref:hypothetical protein n=1 Tax=Bacteroides ihuae TaxID=1852362 RepID=UPI00135628C5|nr:hypothetical protein [Bacteroides ihuae]